MIMFRNISAYLWMIALLSPIGNLHAQQNETGLFYANEQLSDAVKEEKAFDLMLNLRCIQCQGQSIADSDAPIALAMRHQVRLQIEEGKNSEEIESWMIARYGDYVSFEPPASGVSILLWTAPLVVFLLALFLVIPLFRRQKSTVNEQSLDDKGKTL